MSCTQRLEGREEVIEAENLGKIIHSKERTRTRTRARVGAFWLCVEQHIGQCARLEVKIFRGVRDEVREVKSRDWEIRL